MELNSEAVATEETTEASGLDAILEKSRENLAQDAGKKGRPPKYASDEERKAARRAQDRAYKAARRGDRPAAGVTIEMERVSTLEPKPAGLGPMLAQAVDVPVYELRSHFGLTKEELPDLDQEAKEAFVQQADLVIGIFCPDAGNNKWVLLGSLVASAGILYGRLFAQARSIAIGKAQAAQTVESRPLETHENAFFPPATLG